MNDDWIRDLWPKVPHQLQAALALLCRYREDHDYFRSLQEAASEGQGQGFAVSVRTMAKHWGCSVGTAHKRLMRLVEEGILVLVDQAKGRGGSTNVYSLRVDEDGQPTDANPDDMPKDEKCKTEPTAADE